MGSAALIWLLVGLVLVGLELLGAEFEGLLAAAVAALTVSALCGLVALPPLLQVALFAGITAALLAGLLRWGQRRQRAIAPPASGDTATVISGFLQGTTGRVLWQGQSWAATNLEPGQPLQAGAAVLVLGREGTRLQVLPQASGMPDPPGSNDCNG